MNRRRPLGIALVAVALLAALLLPAAAFAKRERFDTRVFAHVGRPGFPALAYVHPDGRVYEGTYTNPTGDDRPSRVLEYDGHGKQLRSWTIEGQDLSAEHGVQVAISDARGRLVLLDRTPARALSLDPDSGRQRTYATFADLPTCPPGQTGPHCSPALQDLAPVPDYAAWGRDGSLYVTDFQQAVIWRVPPGGGKARIWLADRRLDGNQFGTAGIVLAPDRQTLLFSQQSSAGGGDGDPTTGKLYSVAIRGNGDAGHIHRIWESDPGDGPDGFALARSGHIYIALAGSNQLALIGSHGREMARFPATPQTGENGSPVPFDTPSSVMFRGRRLLVANQSFFTGDRRNQVILDVEAREPGEPVFIPGDARAERR